MVDITYNRTTPRESPSFFASCIVLVQLRLPVVLPSWTLPPVCLYDFAFPVAIHPPVAHKPSIGLPVHAATSIILLEDVSGHKRAIVLEY